jgi:hypothetical protein
VISLQKFCFLKGEEALSLVFLRIKIVQLRGQNYCCSERVKTTVHSGEGDQCRPILIWEERWLEKDDGQNTNNL